MKNTKTNTVEKSHPEVQYIGVQATEKKVLAAGSQAWDGSQLPDYPIGEPDVVVTRLTIQPGAQLPVHVHPVINAGMVISGELTVVSATGEECTFGPGEAIIEMTGRAHHGENRGTEPVDLVMFYAASPGTPLTLPVTSTPN